MKKIVTLTENQLGKIIKRVLNESYLKSISGSDDVCEIYCKRKVARYGSTGDVVKMIQHLLYINKFNTPYAGGGMTGDFCYKDWTKCDGLFRDKTMAAVIEFQKSVNLVADGAVGYDTLSKMCDLQFSSSLQRHKLCKDCFCNDKQKDPGLIDNRKKSDIDLVDCEKLKNCVKKFILGSIPSIDEFKICLGGKSGEISDKLSCEMCNRLYPTKYVNKMPGIGTTDDRLKIGDWCITNCGFKPAY